MSRFKRVLAGIVYALRYVAAIAIPLAIGGVVVLLIDARIDQQQRRNALLQDEIRRLNEVIVEIKVLERELGGLRERVALIDQLRRPAVDVAEVVMELSHAPEGVGLTRFTYDGHEMEIEGEALGQELVWSLSDAVHRNPSVSTTSLRSVDALTPSGRSRFSMTATRVEPVEREE